MIQQEDQDRHSTNLVQALMQDQVLHKEADPKHKIKIGCLLEMHL